MHDAEQVLMRPVVSEKTYALMDGRRLRLRGRPRRHQDRRPPRRRAGLRRPGDKVNTLNRKGKRRRNRTTNTVGTGPTPSGPSSPSPRGDKIDLFEKS